MALLAARLPPRGARGAGAPVVPTRVLFQPRGVVSVSLGRPVGTPMRMDDEPAKKVLILFLVASCCWMRGMAASSR